MTERRPCTPTFKKFTKRETAEHTIKLDKGWSLYHSWCDGCGIPLVVAVRDDTVPIVQDCMTCRAVRDGEDLRVPSDDKEMLNFYLKHVEQMMKWTETCRR